MRWVTATSSKLPQVNRLMVLRYAPDASVMMISRLSFDPMLILPAVTSAGEEAALAR
jgi:hypothetical protein